MRTFLLSVGIAGVLIVTALAVAPSVVDWNAYRGALGDELSRATGRTVSLDGPIEASLLPAPRILANNIRLSAGNSAGDRDDALRLRAVELKVGLLPLLTGRIVVERLTLVRPEFLVETEKDGRVRWVMDGAGGELLPEVALQRLAISDGTLVWRDRRDNAQTRVEKIFLRMTATSLSGPATADGTATIGGEPVKFSASIGGVRGDTPVRVNAAVDATALKARSEFVGQYLPAEQRITGRVKASGNDARAVLAAFAGDAAAQGVAPALIAHRFALEGRVSASGHTLEANDVVLDLADQRATGTLRARLTDTRATDIEAAIRLPRLNLDSLATVPPLPVAADANTTLRADARIALSLEADAVLAAGRAVQGFAAEAALDRGAIAVKRVEGQLPGAGSFRVAGAVAPAERGYRFDGTVETASANLRDLLSWLDVDTRAIPSGRLGRATLKAKLVADAQRTELRDVDLHVDATRAHGSVRVDYADRPKVSVDLAADQLDADAYVGDGEDRSPGSASLAGLAGEGKFTIGRLTYRDVDLRDVDLTAAMTDGAFTVTYFSGGPPELDRMFARNPGAAEETASAPAEPEPAPVAAIQVPPASHDAEAVAVPAAASAPPAPPAPSRDDFVRDLLGRLTR